MEDAYSLRTPDRVPILSMVDNYAIHYAGYTLKEILEDDEKHYRAYERIIEDFFWDATMYSGITKAMKFFDVLGGGAFTVTESLQIASGAAMNMEEDEYKELAKDPEKFFLNTVYPRKYKLLREPFSENTYNNFALGVDKLFDFLKLSSNNVQRFKNDHGMLVARGATSYMPLDLILDFLRDFQGTMMDVRRRPEEMVEACDSLADYVVESVDRSYPKHVAGKTVYVPLHAPQFLRPKIFEKVYYPSFMKVLEKFNERGLKALLYFEKNWEHLYDYLKELPLDTVVGYFEDDDIRKAKKELGSRMCIVGGMPIHKLMYGSVQDCVDEAKGLIDDVAPGGGYIFCTNVILHNSGDTKPENLRAVNEFVRDYGKY